MVTTGRHRAQRSVRPLTMSTQSNPTGLRARSVRPALGLALAILLSGTVVARQLSSIIDGLAPSTETEAALGANGFALLHLQHLDIPSSVTDAVASWQLAGYSYLTSAFERHATLGGATREFVLVISVLTAALIAAVCRQLRVGWSSTALAVAVSVLPAAAASLRIMAAPAAIATFWMALAGLCAVAAADRHARWDGGLGRAPPGSKPASWSLCGVMAVASVVGIMTAGVSALLLVGLVLGVAGTRPFEDAWDLSSRVLALFSLSALLGTVFFVTVWGPALQGGDVVSVGVLGVAVALGGLVVAAACSQIRRFAPIALGAIPILFAAAWPGPAQASALVMGFSILAVLGAGLLDSLLSQHRPHTLVGAIGLLVAISVGVFILPAPETTAATVTPTAGIASWIDSQLEPDRVVQVDPLSLAQLVRDGVDDARLITPAEADGRADFVLAPQSDRVDYPLVAHFGSDGAGLDLRLVVPDSVAYAQASVLDHARRSQFGTALALNPNLMLGTAAVAALQAGDVDTRLMIGLAGASVTVRFAIAQFDGTTGDLETGTILREVTLTDISEVEMSIGAGNAGLGWVAEFFDIQRPPYQPLALIEGTNTLTVRYSAPTPLGLLV